MTSSTDSYAQASDEAQQIIASIREIENSPELKSEAATNPQALLDRLRLSGVARHAVALGIAGLLVAPVVASPDGYWQ